MKRFFVAFLLIFGFLFTQNISAQEEIIFFYSNTCPYCHDVLETIEQYDLDEVLEITKLESSSEGFQEIYHEHLEICGFSPNQGGYPTLYHNEKCYFGKTSNISTLLTLAGVDEVMGESTQQEEENETESENENQERETIQRESLPIWIMLSMLIGPAIFLYIVYLIIKKLNL